MLPREWIRLLSPDCNGALTLRVVMRVWVFPKILLGIRSLRVHHQELNEDADAPDVSK
jgi:hypothetical protein